MRCVDQLAALRISSRRRSILHLIVAERVLHQNQSFTGRTCWDIADEVVSIGEHGCEQRDSFLEDAIEARIAIFF